MVVAIVAAAAAVAVAVAAAVVVAIAVGVVAVVAGVAVQAVVAVVEVVEVVEVVAAVEIVAAVVVEVEAAPGVTIYTSKSNSNCRSSRERAGARPAKQASRSAWSTKSSGQRKLREPFYTYSQGIPSHGPYENC